MQNSDQVEKIKSLISESRLRECFKYIKTNAQELFQNNDLKLLSSQWYDIDRSRQLQLMSIDDYSIQKNRIIQALLNHLDRISEEKNNNNILPSIALQKTVKLRSVV